MLLPSCAPTSVSKAQHSDGYIEFRTRIFFFFSSLTMAASAIVPHIKCRSIEPRALFKTFPRIWQSVNNTQNTFYYIVFEWSFLKCVSLAQAECAWHAKVSRVSLSLSCRRVVSSRWWMAQWTLSRQLIRWWVDFALGWWRSASSWRSRAPTLVSPANSLAETVNGASLDRFSGERKNIDWRVERKKKRKKRPI